MSEHQEHDNQDAPHAGDRAPQDQPQAREASEGAPAGHGDEGDTQEGEDQEHSTQAGEGESKASREARYRVRAREAEAKLAAAQAWIAERQTAEVRQAFLSQLTPRIGEVAARGMASLIPAQEFLNDTGDVDTDKVRDKVAELAPTGATLPDFGQGERGSVPTGAEITWQDAFRTVLGDAR